MSKLVVISLGQRDLGTGFPNVTAQLWSEDNPKPEKFTGRIGVDREVSLLYRRWQQLYEACYKRFRFRRTLEIEIEEDDETTHFSEEEFRDLSEQLQQQMNVWLERNEFRRIDRQLRSHLDITEEIQVLIETDDDILQRLPWHLWTFFEDFTRAEMALSPPEYQVAGRELPKFSRSGIRILAILGNGAGIDTNGDRKLLENLPNNAETVFLVEPSREELNQQLWDEAGWDILFFAGHSQTEGNWGKIEINPKESLTIAQLRNALKEAIKGGLHLAIFNSCDGLGLARSLGNLHIPQMIVMREPVPDRVAQEFLKHFLETFSQGQSLYSSVRTAREKLQGLEGDFPCASWLPILCQNPAESPKTWKELLESKQGGQTGPARPYQGLFAFREEDAPLFFGRETFVKQLVAAVNQKSLVGVIGPSGSGKSSVVFAGLIPQLQDAANWKIAQCRTGERPFYALISAIVPLLDPEMGRADRIFKIQQWDDVCRNSQWGLRDLVEAVLSEAPRTRLLLAIDQFEELYTLCQDSEQRQHFLNKLLETINHTEGFTVVLTLRADFYGQVLSSRPFADALQDGDIKLAPMNRQELEDAIIKPAEYFGVQVQPGLTGRILDEIKEEPGSLPLLEFALTQLWDKQQDGCLSHSTYNEIGGVKAAVAQYAEEVYQQLSPEEQAKAERVFIQLVRPGEGTEDTRRVTTRTEIGEENWDLVKRLADARLVVTGRKEQTRVNNTIDAEETVEVVHEALIREWKRLRTWMDANRDFRSWQDRLKAARHQWKSTNQDKGALLRGVPLATAEEWLQKRLNELSPEQREYIQISLEERDREASEQEQARAERQREQQQAQAERLRLQKRAIRGLAGGLMASVILAGLAVVLSINAGLQKKEAEVNEVKALIASSKALFNDDQKLEALIEALRAGKLLSKASWQNPEIEVRAIATLQQAAYGVKERNRLEADTPLNAINISPDGQLIAAAGNDGTVIVWHSNGTVLTTIEGHAGSVTDLSFSPDGNQIATVGEDGMVRIWETSSGEQLNEWSDKEEFTRLGLHLVDLKDEGDQDTYTMLVKDVIDNSAAQKAGVEKGDRLLLINSKKTTGVSLDTLQEVGNSEILDSSKRQAILRIGRKGEEEFTLTIEREIMETVLNAVSFSPDGKILVTAGDRGRVTFWNLDIDSPEPIDIDRKLLKLEKSVTDVSFSSDGKLIATAHLDGIVALWRPDGSIANGLSLRGKDWKFKSFVAVTFSPNGDTIVTATEDNQIQLWYKDGRRMDEVERYAYVGYISDLVFSPDGTQFAVVGNGETISLWTSEGLHLRTIQAHDNTVSGVRFSPNGKQIITSSHDRTVKFWISENLLVKSLEAHSNGVYSVAFTPNGQTIASVGGDDQIKLWNRQGVLQKSWSSKDSLTSSSFSPDGQLLASFGLDKTIKLWNRDGTLHKTLEGHRDLVKGVSFSQDGQVIASISKDKTVKLWNQDGDLLNNLNITSEDSDFSVASVSLSPDGNLIAVAHDAVAELWNRDGTRVETLKGHRNTVTKVVFDPEGKTIATASYDGKVHLWNLDGELLTIFSGHDNGVVDVKFSPEGQMLATASFDNTVRLWDRDGELRATLEGHQNAVVNINFSPDGQTLASASHDGQIILWEANPDLEKTIVKACHWVRDYLRKNSEVQESDKHLCNGVEPYWLAEGEELAHSGDIQGAIEKFQKTQRVNRGLEFDPEQKAKQLAAIGLVEKGKILTVGGKIEEAIATYKKAEKTNPEIMSATWWNSLCWHGGKYRYDNQEVLRDILEACEKAVSLNPGDGQYRDSRGFVRLLLKDLTGAAEDFQAYIDWWDRIKVDSEWTDTIKNRYQWWSQRRQRWVQEIKNGKEFTPEEIKKEIDLLNREE